MNKLKIDIDTTEATSALDALLAHIEKNQRLLEEMSQSAQKLRALPWSRAEKLMFANTIVTGLLVGVLIFLALK